MVVFIVWGQFKQAHSSHPSHCTWFCLFLGASSSRPTPHILHIVHDFVYFWGPVQAGPLLTSFTLYMVVFIVWGQFKQAHSSLPSHCTWYCLFLGGQFKQAHSSHPSHCTWFCLFLGSVQAGPLLTSFTLYIVVFIVWGQFKQAHSSHPSHCTWYCLLFGASSSRPTPHILHIVHVVFIVWGQFKQAHSSHPSHCTWFCLFLGGQFKQAHSSHPSHCTWLCLLFGASSNRPTPHFLHIVHGFVYFWGPVQAGPLLTSFTLYMVVFIVWGQFKQAHSSHPSHCTWLCLLFGASSSRPTPHFLHIVHGCVYCLGPVQAGLHPSHCTWLCLLFGASSSRPTPHILHIVHGFVYCLGPVQAGPLLTSFTLYMVLSIVWGQFKQAHSSHPSHCTWLCLLFGASSSRPIPHILHIVHGFVYCLGASSSRSTPHILHIVHGCVYCLGPVQAGPLLTSFTLYMVLSIVWGQFKQAHILHIVHGCVYCLGPVQAGPLLTSFTLYMVVFIVWGQFKQAHSSHPSHCTWLCLLFGASSSRPTPHILHIVHGFVYCLGPVQAGPLLTFFTLYMVVFIVWGQFKQAHSSHPSHCTWLCLLFGGQFKQAHSSHPSHCTWLCLLFGASSSRPTPHILHIVHGCVYCLGPVQAGPLLTSFTLYMVVFIVWGQFKQAHSSHPSHCTNSSVILLHF